MKSLLAAAMLLLLSVAMSAVEAIKVGEKAAEEVTLKDLLQSSLRADRVLSNCMGAGALCAIQYPPSAPPWLKCNCPEGLMCRLIEGVGNTPPSHLTCQSVKQEDEY